MISWSCCSALDCSAQMVKGGPALIWKPFWFASDPDSIFFNSLKYYWANDKLYEWFSIFARFIYVSKLIRFPKLCFQVNHYPRNGLKLGNFLWNGLNLGTTINEINSSSEQNLFLRAHFCSFWFFNLDKKLFFWLKRCFRKKKRF